MRCAICGKKIEEGELCADCKQEIGMAQSTDRFWWASKTQTKYKPDYETNRVRVL